MPGLRGQAPRDPVGGHGDRPSGTASPARTGWQISPGLRAELDRRAAELGIGDAVEILGYVDDAEYRNQLARATCAVQLRRSHASGEGSAAVNDALAVGLPVITNIASSHELPPGSVGLLAPDASPSDVAREILLVLDDQPHRARLSDAAIAFSRAWTFENVTKRLLEIIDTTRVERWEHQSRTA